MRNWFLIFIILTITGCVGKTFSSDSVFAPRPAGMGGPPKDADPEYLEGWNDGCDTGLSTMNPSYYKSFYKFKQDPYRIDNERYYQAWKDAYTYCRQYSFRYVWDTIDNTRAKGPLCVLCPNDIR